jgi:hypothetical protein
MPLPGKKRANATLTHYGVTTTFSRAGENFMVRTEGPDGALHDYEIANPDIIAESPQSRSKLARHLGNADVRASSRKRH